MTKFIMNCFTLLFCIFLSQFVIISAKKCSDKDSEEADLCMAKVLLIGDRSQRFRETLEEMHQYCKNITELQNCVKHFSRTCLPRFARQVTNQLLTGVTKVNKPLCKDDQTKRAFGQVAKCGNIGLEGKHTCMEKFIEQLKITETVNSDKKIPYVCCNFWRFKACVRATFDGIDEKKCPQKSIDSVMNLITGYSGDTLDMICGDFDDGSDKCKKLLDNSKSANKSETKTPRKAKSRAHSILPSFIKIFTTI